VWVKEGVVGGDMQDCAFLIFVFGIILFQGINACCSCLFSEGNTCWLLNLWIFQLIANPSGITLGAFSTLGYAFGIGN
jgi:hypothetical protein